MVYIICIQKDEKNEISGYRAFETSSESALELTPGQLRDLIVNNVIQVVNASIQNHSIVIKKWINGITIEKKLSASNNRMVLGPTHILIASESNSFKVVGYKGGLYIMRNIDLQDLIGSNKMANCGIIKIRGVKQNKIEDVYTIQKDKEFESHIAEKYNIFIAKTKILGQKDSTFGYQIENKEVRLSHYIGSNRDLIVPPFITAIKQDTFFDNSIEAVRFSEGLKVIGSEAFYTYNEDAASGKGKSIGSVEIPSTVGLICNNAFNGNYKLYDEGKGMDEGKFKIINKRKTVVANQRG